MILYCHRNSAQPDSASFVRLCLYDICKTSEPFVFAKHSFGKPYIDTPRQFAHIKFNVSHCGGLIVCAVSETSEVGADAERVVPRNAADRIAARYYTEQERAYMSAARDPMEAFYEIWTAKEAYIKYTGRGLSEGLRGFSTIENGGFAACVNGITLVRPQLPSMPEYRCAVCVSRDPRIVLKEIENV